MKTTLANGHQQTMWRGVGEKWAAYILIAMRYLLAVAVPGSTSDEALGTPSMESRQKLMRSTTHIQRNKEYINTNHQVPPAPPAPPAPQRMSEYQKSIFQKKLRQAEQALGFDYSEEAEENHEEDQNETIAPLPSDAPFPPTKAPRPLSSLLSFQRGQKQYTKKAEEEEEEEEEEEDVKPKSWSEFFEHNEVFEDSNGSKFNVYYTKPGNKQSPMFVFHHGAGSSGLTFANLCKSIANYIEEENKNKKKGQSNNASSSISRDENIKPGFLVFDARGHGATKVYNPNDFSRVQFCKDFAFILRYYLTTKDSLFNDAVSHKQANPSLEYPPVILVGHSLGGAVLTEALHNGSLDDLNAAPKTGTNIIKGLVMFDIVEDTAVQSLVHMNTFLQSRPKGFRSLKTAIDWHTKANNLLKNKDAALVSVPALLKLNETGNEDERRAFKYVWRAELQKTEPYWDTWFGGLSDGFVSAPVLAKLLVLAGNDSLDKSLMIGQMQGKFQLIVFLDSGHFIQEDVPNKTALSLIDFWKRNFFQKKQTIPILWGHLRN